MKRFNPLSLAIAPPAPPPVPAPEPTQTPPPPTAPTIDPAAYDGSGYEPPPGCPKKVWPVRSLHGSGFCLFDPRESVTIGTQRATLEEAKLDADRHNARFKPNDLQAKYEAERAKGKEQLAAIMAKRPSWAKALIVAEFERDNCDLQSDYFSTKTERTVAIGWRRGPREDFKQLRNAAAGFEPTKQLATAPPDAEHRERYSMGRGLYLKASGHYSTGWLVYSLTIGDNGLPYLNGLVEDAIPAPPPPTASAITADPGATSSTGMTIKRDIHTKRQVPIWIAQLTERVASNVFSAHNARAKTMGGYYSSYGARDRHGFIFFEEAHAYAFAGLPKPGLTQVADALPPEAAAPPTPEPATSSQAFPEGRWTLPPNVPHPSTWTRSTILPNVLPVEFAPTTAPDSIPMAQGTVPSPQPEPEPEQPAMRPTVPAQPMAWRRFRR